MEVSVKSGEGQYLGGGSALAPFCHGRDLPHVRDSRFFEGYAVAFGAVVAPDMLSSDFCMRILSPDRHLLPILKTWKMVL
jgi:hypothetical protein